MTVAVREFTLENIHELRNHYLIVQERVNPNPETVFRRDLLRVRSDFKRDILYVQSEPPAEGKPISRPMFVPEDGPVIPMPREAMKAVCARFKITRAELLGGGQEIRVARPRQIAMHLMVRECGLSQKETGRRLGGRDHTTILHGLRQIEKKIRTDNEILAAVVELTQQLRSGRWIIVTDLAA